MPHALLAPIAQYLQQPKESVGNAVGDAVGDLVGEGVGTCVGAGVGTAAMNTPSQCPSAEDPVNIALAHAPCTAHGHYTHCRATEFNGSRTSACVGNCYAAQQHAS